MVRSSLATAGVVVVLLGACTGSDADPLASPSPSTTRVGAPSPTPSPEPTPSPTPTEVLPANDVADPVAALEAIVRYRDQLFENPDPEKLELIYAERCECYEEVYEVLDAFKADGRHIEMTEERSYEFLEVLDRSGPSVRLRYRVGTPGFLLRAADGEVIEEVPATDPGIAEAFLVSEGGRWRVVALVEEG